jgi:hypothetical protein
MDAAVASSCATSSRSLKPIGCSSVFPGMRAVKSDGSRFHLIGIQPTIQVSPTIAGNRGRSR